MCAPSSWFHHGVESYVLEKRVSTECLLHLCHPEIVVPNSLLSLDIFLSINGLLSWMQSMKDCWCCCRCRRCCLRGGQDFPTFVEATVSRCTPEGLTFVSALFESYEPYLRYSTVGLEDSRYILSKFSSFLRTYCEPKLTIHGLSKFIWKFSLEHSMMVLVLGDNFEFLQLYLVPVTNNFVTDCTNSNFSTLNPCFIDLSCELL